MATLDGASLYIWDEFVNVARRPYSGVIDTEQYIGCPILYKYYMVRGETGQSVFPRY